jgi:hypothetical protein
MNSNGEHEIVAIGWRELTLPTSGVVVRVRRIAPALLTDLRKDIRRRFPKPSAPMVEVNYGNEKRVEPNPAHPDYAETLKEHATESGMAFLESLAKFGCECEIDNARVAELRGLADGMELPADDRVLYITRVLLETKSDIEVFQQAIMGLSQSTEKAVAEATERFPGNV